MILNLLQLGRIPYPDALALQQRLVQLRYQQQIANTLLLLEHPPVLTLGRNTQRENILATDELLARRGVTIHEINRGGDVTYHGPGQLVGYPILDLRSFTPRLGAVDYVRKLEEVLIRSCASYGVITHRVPRLTGVWTLPSGTVDSKKIAAIGVHISRGITSHGFALNITTDLRDFGLIVPCGISNRGVTSLEAEMDFTNHPIPTLQLAGNIVARNFGIVFGTQVLCRGSVDELLSDANLSPALPETTHLRIPKDLKHVHEEGDPILA